METLERVQQMETLTLDCVQKLVDGAIAKANTDFHRPICVSVCDHNGFLVAFARMDGAPIRSIVISQNKAFTAVRMGVPTDKFFARLQQDHLEASYFGENLSPLAGGNLLKDPDGKVLGAIGVSGLALTEDQSITETLAELANSGRL
jgi:glc operon protein GlcG